MAEMTELGSLSRFGVRLNELSIITTNRNVTSQGNNYIELSVDGKSFIFFCPSCFVPIDSDSELCDHMKHKLQRLKLDIFNLNPWPFNDGLNFFDNPLPVSEFDLGGIKVLDPKRVGVDFHESSYDGDFDRVIMGVLQNGEKSDLGLRFMGLGQIGARFLENDNVLSGIKKIWCEWLGKKDVEDTLMDKEHEFSVIAFSYNDNLGKDVLVDDLNYFLHCIPEKESENTSGGARKKRKVRTQFGKNSQHLDRNDNQLSISRIRQKCMRQKRVAGQGVCDICYRKMVPGKDVATLLNSRTGRLSCSSRNWTGEFHVSHISCLVHWILNCDYEIWTKDYKEKMSCVLGGIGDDGEQKEIYRAFCPDCRGTGIGLGGRKLQTPAVPLSEMIHYTMKIKDASKRWIESPEDLQNCSIGLHFASQSEELVQEKVLPLKNFRFYRAKE